MHFGWLCDVYTDIWENNINKWKQEGKKSKHYVKDTNNTVLTS